MAAAAAGATGAVRVEKVRGRSALTRCFARYPLKLIAPSKAGPAACDAVWLYALNYGGGIVSGDTVSCTVSVGGGCTAAITTQASTKVYKALGSKCSEQFLEAHVGEDAMLAVIPDPVTCFSTARYYQKQVFHVFANSNLVLVDWFTSGRYESGEKWDFNLYKSVNHIYLEDQPLFIDSVLLEQGSNYSIADRMQEYNVIAMVVLLGPKLKPIQDKMQDGARKMMGTGMVARVAAVSTESVYSFLRHHLAALEPFLGASPYSSS
ncbi:hypothetical protein ACP4OV_009475 [Aristida adscensionis]